MQGAGTCGLVQWPTEQLQASLRHWIQDLPALLGLSPHGLRLDLMFFMRFSALDAPVHLSPVWPRIPESVVYRLYLRQVESFTFSETLLMMECLDSLVMTGTFRES